MKNRIQLLGVGAVALLALAGCSAPAPAPTAAATQEAATQDAATQDAGAPTAQAPSTDATGTAEAPSVASVGDPLVTQEFTVPMTKNKVEVAIHSLKVHGKVMELTMTVTPHFTQPTTSEPMNYWDVFNQSTTGPQLIDRVNLKEYHPVKVPSSTGLTTLNNTPMVWVGWYAAPQDPIETIDIRVMDGVPNFLNVPVTR